MGCRGFSHFVLNILTFENKLQLSEGGFCYIKSRKLDNHSGKLGNII